MRSFVVLLKLSLSLKLRSTRATLCVLMTVGAGAAHGVNAFDVLVQALFALEGYPTRIASEFTAQFLSAQQLLSVGFLVWLERLEQNQNSLRQIRS